MGVEMQRKPAKGREKLSSTPWDEPLLSTRFPAGSETDGVEARNYKNVTGVSKGF